MLDSEIGERHVDRCGGKYMIDDGAFLNGQRIADLGQPTVTQSDQFDPAMSFSSATVLNGKLLSLDGSLVIPAYHRETSPPTGQSTGQDLAILFFKAARRFCPARAD